MRACEPDGQGYVESGGVKVSYEVFGHGDPTLLLLPTWTIVHSRCWKLQVPYLARHHRVVTFDGPGNGGADRPLDPAAYGQEAQVRRALAVLDATGTDRAVVVSLSKGAHWALQLAAEHPQRVLGSVVIAPSVALTHLSPERTAAWQRFDEPYDHPEGCDKYNANYWRDHYEDFAEFFFSQCFPEPHSTKQREDCVGWARETSAEVLLAELRAGLPDEETVRGWARRIGSAVLVVHGEDDRVSPLSRGQALAAETGGHLVVTEGTGHLPHARDPVRSSAGARPGPRRRPAPGPGNAISSSAWAARSTSWNARASARSSSRSRSRAR